MIRRKIGSRYASFLVVGVFAAILLSSCQFLNNLINPKADLTVTSVQPLMTGTQVTGIRVVLNNSGGSDANNVGYDVLLSTDTTISTTNDLTIYHGTTNVAAGQTQQVDLDGQTVIGPYMQNASITVPDGTYYIGIMVNPSGAIQESNTANNSGVSTTTLRFVGGNIVTYLLKGTITLPAGLTYKSVTGGSAPVPNGSYTLWVGIVPGTFQVSSSATSVDPSTVFQAGQQLTVSYNGSQTSVNFAVGVPDPTVQYYIGAALDENNNGVVDLDGAGGPPWEPFANYPADGSGNPLPQTWPQDQSGITFPLGNGQ